VVNLQNTIVVFGLGYIGLPFTAALANIGYKVIGVDINQQRIDSLKRGEVPFYEPGVKETLEKNREKIEYTSDETYAIQNADTIFITVGTPTNDNDEPDYSHIDSCIESIGRNLKKGQLVVLKSTVVVGTTEERVAPKLQALSGLVPGQDFYLSFFPERTIEGLALHEIYHLPKIVGGINQESAIKTKKIIQRLGSLVTLVSSTRAAEMCKLVDNLYRAQNIAFANEMGMLCEKMDIDTGEVVSAVKNSYPRTNIFSPGLGADGPCLSKDPFIFKHSALKHNVPTPVTDGSITQNKESTLRVANLVKEFVLKNKPEKINLAIVGLAFKGFPETDDLRGSPAEKIINALKKDDVKIDSIKLYDPLVKNFPGHEIKSTITETIQDSNIVLFLTNHPKIMNIDAELVNQHTPSPVFVIDAWGNINLNSNSLPEQFHYFRIGKGQK
tara:strand:- start:5473 stop:6798 length:1326 start_codon:yes stop_codon:yes gene_type:complete